MDTTWKEPQTLQFSAQALSFLGLLEKEKMHNAHHQIKQGDRGYLDMGGLIKMIQICPCHVSSVTYPCLGDGCSGLVWTTNRHGDKTQGQIINGFYCSVLWIPVPADK